MGVLYEKCMGYLNHETWLCAQWFSHDEVARGAADRLIQTADSANEYAALLQSWVEGENPLANASGLFADLMASAIERVDWQGIANAHWDNYAGEVSE